MVGRRHNEALSVGAGRIIHRARWGSESCALDSVVGIDLWVRGAHILVECREPVERTVSPWPWPWPGKPNADPHEIKIKTSLMGHSAEDLAAWLSSQVPGMREPGPDQQHEEPSIIGGLRRRFGGRGR